MKGRFTLKSKGNMVLFLYFFLIVVVIISIAAIPINYIMTERLKHDISAADQLLLKQIKTNVDMVLQQSDRITIRMTMNASLEKLVAKNSTQLYNYDPQELYNLNRYIFSEKDSYQFINSVYVYLPKSGEVFMNYSMYRIGDFNDRQFINSLMFTTGPKSTSLIGPREIKRNKSFDATMPIGSVISLYRRFNYGGSANKPVLVIVNLKIDALKQMIQDVGGVKDLEFYMVNDKGDIAISYNNADNSKNLIKDGISADSFQNKSSWEQTFNGRKMLISSVTSGYNNWRYIIMIPQKTALAPVTETQKYVFILLAACFITGLLLALLLSRRYYSPIRRLMQNILPNNAGGKIAGNEFDMLGSMFRNLENENIHNKNIIQSNMNIIKDKYVADMLNGNCSISPNIVLNIDLKFDNYRVVCIERDDIYKLEHVSETDKILAMHNIERIISGVFSGHSDDCVVLTTKILDKRMAIILNYGDSLDEEALDRILEKLHEEIRIDLGFTCTFGIGNIYYEANELPISYTEAVSALRHKVFFRNNSSIYYNSINKQETLISFDECIVSGKKQILLESIKAKNPEAANHVISEIEAAMAGIAPEYFERAKFFIVTICQDLARLIYNTGKSDESILNGVFSISQDIRKAQSIYELIEILKKQSEKVMEFLVEKTQIVNKEMISQVISYINEHYNEDYSIEILAEKIKFSAAYLGKLIKNATGQTFPQYVTQLRIDKAKEMLNNSDHKIGEIYEQLGFTNRQNFIRAFKACTGFTPSEYRQKNAEGNLSNN